MFEDSPVKKILFDKLVEMGRLPSNPQTSLFLEMGFDKMFDLLSMLPMMKDGGVVDYNDKE